jgi:hypothetical protein
MTDVGKFLVIGGLLLALTGAAIWGLGRAGFRGLPGDFRYETEQVRVYFPIVTCLVLSALASAAMWLWNWFTRR